MNTDRLSLGGKKVSKAINVANKILNQKKKLLKKANKVLKYPHLYDDDEVEAAKDISKELTTDMDYYRAKVIAAGAMAIMICEPPGVARWNKWSDEKRANYDKRKADAEAVVADFETATP